MTFMKKDVNFGLFILIIATLVSFAVFSTYYQGKFENLSADYNSKIDAMEKLTTKLQLEKAKLNETSFELVKTTQKAEDISGKYGNLRDEKEKLEADIAKLTADLTQKKAKLAETEITLSQKETILQATQAELSVVEEDLSECRADKSVFEDGYEDCCDALVDDPDGICG